MSFKPVVALVGRPNVGKSTLFNRLTRSRSALVADFSGLTRDRHYGEGRVGEKPFIVVDTGGFEPVAKSGILHAMAQQTKQAIAEADVVIFLVDARAGLNAHDHDIAGLDDVAVTHAYLTDHAAGRVLHLLDVAVHDNGALRQHGPLLVCCALGYSRSACAVAAWLIGSGRAASVDEALALLQRARPQIVLGPAHREALARLSPPPETVGGA